MKKTLLLILLICLKGFSQNIEKSIIIKDIDTNLPIEDVTVYIVKTKQNLLSNTDGKVTFVSKYPSNILISHSSYLSITIRSITLQETENIVYLKSNVNIIDDIIITKKHPQKILKSLVENSIKKLTVPGRLKVYSREFFKLNGDYTYYNDGLMNFQLLDKAEICNTNILVEQSRSYGLIDKEISSEFLGYNLNNIMENYYKFKYLAPILEPQAKKEYQFLIKSYLANNSYFMITVTPLDETKGLRDDFSIIYDTEKKIIIEVSSFISPKTIAKNIDKTAVGSKNIYKSTFKTIYKFDNINYYLVSSKEEIGYERIDKKKKITDIEIKNEMVTTNFSTQNYSYNKCDVFKNKTLFNRKNEVLSNYWAVSGLTATEEEQEIIERIENQD